MQSLRNLALAGAAALALVPAAARGADLPAPPMFRAPIIEEYGAWYLRGDIGITNQRVKRLDSPAPGFDTTTMLVQGFDSAGLFGLGVGYKFNSWFRVDVTGDSVRIDSKQRNPNGCSWPTPSSISALGIR